MYLKMVFIHSIIMRRCAIQVLDTFIEETHTIFFVDLEF